MNGDLVFVDFENSGGETENSPPSGESKTKKTESREEKLARLAAQIESGEYEVPTERLSEILLEELTED